MTRRFLDVGTFITAFGDEFLVRCPRCSQCAQVAGMPHASPPEPGRSASARLFDPRRCVCAHCAYAAEWSKDAPTQRDLHGSTFQLAMASHGRVSASIVIGGPVDWYFRLPLWLQTPCRGHILWAYNAAHLAFLREYVRADLRERVPVPNTNTSLASQLPAWMKRARNRDDVLKGIARLEDLLAR